jgi:pimeloyl-ACP methyl ester carboxylesterase
VGHSYGGAVITNAGNHGRVRGLVYIAAFAPDDGEAISDIADKYAPGQVASFMTRGPDGEWMMEDSEASRQALAWDVPDEIWETRMLDSRASADAIFSETTTSPAWASRPSWYLVASRDQNMPPEAQRDMAARAGAFVDEVDTSHAVPHAAPERVMTVIARALDAIAG